MRVHNESTIIVVLAFVGSLVGCAPIESRAFVTPFLPPSPRPPAPAAAEPPSLESALDLYSTPKFLNQQPSTSPVRGVRADTVVQQAESHFQAGKRRFQEGDMAGARSEFDQAIDLLLAVPEGAAARPSIEHSLEELVEAIHHYDLAGLAGSDPLAEPGFQKPPLEDLPTLTFPIDPALKNKVLEEAKATVSQLPLVVNDSVLSYIKYFTSERGRKVIIFGQRRAGRYRAMIQRILDEEGVPQELMMLAQAESGFLPRAVSRASATGMWQFMQSRGRQYGLQQTPYSDERLDPERATRAAARHLRDLYSRYGDWYLAMAAYNCGPGVVDKAVERTGYADFWELSRRSVLPKETANYVPIILAMTIIIKNAQEYGLGEIDPDPALQYDAVELKSNTHLALISDLVDRPVTDIRELNPALLKNTAPAGYVLRVPKGSGQALIAALDGIPEGKRDAWRAHRFAEGDSLASIARSYRVSEDALAGANQGIDGRPEVGDIILVPAAPVLERTVGKRALRRGKHGTATTVEAKRTGGSHARNTHSASRRGSRSGSHTAARKSTRAGARTSYAANRTRHSGTRR